MLPPSMQTSRLLAILVTTMLVLAAAACSGDDDNDVPEFPSVIPLGEGDVFPSIVNTSLSIGPNRVLWNLIDNDDNLLLDGGLRVRYFNLNGEEPRFTEEVEARLVSTELNFIHENNGRARTVTGTGGVYVTNAHFDEAGDWGAEVKVFRRPENATILYRFTVRDDSEEPSIGDLAPASVQATTATEPIEEIDSSYPFRQAMHTTTVADALKAGQPIVIAFATPAFCASRTCGPVLDLVVDPLFWQYGDRAQFIHIEPYVLRDAREANLRNPVPTALEWRLRTEPWIFVVAPDGRIAAKFEGIVARDEVEAALLPLLDAGTSGSTPSPAP